MQALDAAQDLDAADRRVHAAVGLLRRGEDLELAAAGAAGDDAAEQRAAPNVLACTRCSKPLTTSRTFVQKAARLLPCTGNASTGGGGFFFQLMPTSHLPERTSQIWSWLPGRHEPVSSRSHASKSRASPRTSTSEMCVIGAFRGPLAPLVSHRSAVPSRPAEAMRLGLPLQMRTAQMRLLWPGSPASEPRSSSFGAFGWLSSYTRTILSVPPEAHVEPSAE